MRHIILGTAGHIDHGKSSLVKALTGIDPDRLKEEKERGITIDLGFADLSYPDGLTVGIVDVPGHERLVKNMLAGAGGIDLVLLVIAADEGVMPQSREHLHICNLLKIKSGLIAITKADLVEADWLELVQDEVRKFVRGTFLEGTPVISVSSRNMLNMEILKEEIRKAALAVDPKPGKGLFRLPIDRVFTLKGFGTVVTGTAISGCLSVDNPVEILPSNIRTKVRGLHSHGKSLQTAYAGQRVAINLQGVEKEELQRGDTIVIPERFTTTKALDVLVELLSDVPVLKSRSTVHFHLGTSETTARVILYNQEELKAGEQCYCQFRLQEPVISMAGDRFIIRRFSPVETIGGGEVLDPYPPRRRRKEGIEDLPVYATGSLTDKLTVKIQKSGIHGILTKTLEGWIKAEIPAIRESINSLKQKGQILVIDDFLIHRTVFDKFREQVIRSLQDFHRNNPLKPGRIKEDLRAAFALEPRLFGALLAALGKDISMEKELIRLSSFKPALTQSDETLKQKIITELETAGVQPPTKEELSQSLKLNEKQVSDILKLLTKEGSLVRINDSTFVTSAVYKRIINNLQEFFSKKPDMTVAEFRDILGTTRKYALPFLEYLDSNKVTMRVGDVRKFCYREYENRSA
jgi:selenocysteine-specific elongation factor